MRSPLQEPSAPEPDALEARIARLTELGERLQEQIERQLTRERGLAAERAWLRAMINQVPDYLYAKDRKSRFVLANQPTARGKQIATPNGQVTPADLIGKTDFDLFPPETAQHFFDIEQEIMRSGRPAIDMEEFNVEAEDVRKWFLTTKVPLRNERGEIIGLVGIARDVTGRKRAEALQNAQAKLLEMIALDAPLDKVLDSLVRLIEPQLDGIFGSILLLDPEDKRLRHGAAPSLPEAYTRAIDGLAIGPTVGSCGTAAFLREAVAVEDIAADPLWDDYRDLALHFGLRSCWSTPILSRDGLVLGTFAMYSAEVRRPRALERQLIDMATRIAGIAIERKQAEERIQYMAHHDALTGLPNRLLLKDRIEQALLHAERDGGQITVAFVDLDNFKLVNDSLGHGAGDELLKILAARMVKCLRATDTAVRIGGDEFVLLLADQPQDGERGSSLLERIRSAISDPVSICGRELHITCSVGAATFPGDGTNAEALLANADTAMYRAKQVGRDSFQFYTAEMNRKAHERLARQEDLRRAIAHSEFELRYQPQVEVETGRIFAVEALIRWRRADGTLLSPASFIPLAEETGLIVPIGDWVLHTACRQNKAWQEAGLPPITVSVNVSARQFRERNWVQRVAAALAESGLQARFLDLELTESLIMQDRQQAIATMQALECMGVGLSIDDFGTGYSSLSALKSFPVSRLKIDQSFVRGLPHDENDSAIATAIISLAQKLKMRVIAEGVETDEQLDYLRASGCTEIQGYCFSKPLAADMVARLLIGPAQTRCHGLPTGPAERPAGAAEPIQATASAA